MFCVDDKNVRIIVLMRCIRIYSMYNMEIVWMRGEHMRLIGRMS